MYGSFDHGWMFDGGAGMLAAGLWMLLVLAIPVLLIVALLKYLFDRRSSGGNAAPPAPRNALDILKESYARGEIGREEYLQKRDDLLDK